MKRFLVPLFAALALPTAVNSNLIDEYNQQKADKNRCIYYAKNLQWKEKDWHNYLFIDNNKIIKVDGWNAQPFLKPETASCKQIGILNQEYRSKDKGFFFDYGFVTTFSRFENGKNGNLVIYSKKENSRVVKKIFLKFRGGREPLSNSSQVKPSRPDYLKLMDRYTYGDHKRTPLPEYKNKWWNW